MKKTVAILFMFLIAFCSIAQNTTNKDSLISVLQFAKEDTSKIRLLIAIQKYYATKNFDSSLYYLTKAEVLAKKLKTKDFDFLINIGYSEYYYYNNDYKKSIVPALKNKEIAERENDLKKMAKSYNNLSAIYNHFGFHKLAIGYILKCLDISEKTKDSLSFPIRNLTASNTYYDLKQFDKSIHYAKKAIEYGKKYNNSFAHLMGLNNLAASYSGLNKLDSSIYIQKQQLELAKQQEDIVNIVYALINLCADNFKIGNTTALEIYAKELDKYNSSISDSQAIAQIYYAKALNNIALKNYAAAKKQLDNGINISKLAGNTDALGNLYQTYSIVYYLQGNIPIGSTYFYRYDSIISAQNLKELNFYTEEMEVKYNTEKKEAQIQIQQAQLKQRKIINYFLIAIAIALLLLSILIFRIYMHKQKLQQAKIDELEKEKQLQATEAILKGQEEERSRIAKDLHDGLGGLLSSVKYSLNDMKENVILSADNAISFTRSIDMLDSGIQELRRIAHNMMPENLIKFGLDTALNDYCNSISKTNVITIQYSSLQMDTYHADINVSVTVYRIVQELVNNIIKHAKATQAIVQLTKDDNFLNITVEDNGIGFDVTHLTTSKSAGWVNIQNRINYLGGKLEIDSNPTNGTSIAIEIPLS